MYNFKDSYNFNATRPVVFIFDLWINHIAFKQILKVNTAADIRDMADINDDTGGSNEVKRVAIIGSGLAGLSTGYFVSLKMEQEFESCNNEIYLFEKQNGIGMDGSSFTYKNETDECRIDVPLRVISPKYYDSLLQLYNSLKIELTMADCACTYLPSMFKFINIRNSNIGKSIPIPYISNIFDISHIIQTISLTIMYVIFILLCYLYVNINYFRREITDFTNVDNFYTIDKFLQKFVQFGIFSDYFLNNLLYPSMSCILTCDIKHVKNYPAIILLEYYYHLTSNGVRQSKYGTQSAVKIILSNIRKHSKLNVVLNASVNYIEFVATDDTDENKHKHKDKYKYKIKYDSDDKDAAFAGRLVQKKCCLIL